MTWAVGTIYLKLVRIPGDIIVNTAWQIIIAAVVLLFCTLIFQGWPSFDSTAEAAVAVVINGLIGSALCYFLWYNIVGHLPATTASLGSLSSPAIGVVASALLLGEYPTTGDMIGFGLIFAAAMSVILQPRQRQPRRHRLRQRKPADERSRKPGPHAARERRGHLLRQSRHQRDAFRRRARPRPRHALRARPAGERRHRRRRRLLAHGRQAGRDPAALRPGPGQRPGRPAQRAPRPQPASSTSSATRPPTTARSTRR